jgi:hypothetical protein
MQENELEVSEGYMAYRLIQEINHALRLLQKSNKNGDLAEILSQVKEMLDVQYFTEKNDGTA